MKYFYLAFLFWCSIGRLAAQQMTAEQTMMDSLITVEKYAEALPLVTANYEAVFANPQADIFQKAYSIKLFAACIRNLKQLDKAQSLLKAFIESSDSSGWGNHPAMAIVLSELGNIETVKNNYDEAENLLERAQHLSDSTGSVPINTQLSILFRFGYLYTLKNDYINAEKNLLKTLTFLDANHLDKKTMRRRVYNLLVSSYVNLNDAQNAEKYGKIGLAFDKANGYPQDYILGWLALYEYRIEEYAKAEKLYLDLISYLEHSGKKNEGYALAFLNLGYVYTTMGFYEKALNCLKQSYMEIKKYDPGAVQNRGLYNRINQSYAEMLTNHNNDYDAALIVLEEGLKINKEDKEDEYSIVVYESQILNVLAKRDGVEKIGPQIIDLNKKLSKQNYETHLNDLLSNSLLIADYWSAIDSFTNFEAELKHAYALNDSIKGNPFHGHNQVIVQEYTSRLRAGQISKGFEIYHGHIKMQWDFISNFLADFSSSERLGYYLNISPKFLYYLRCLSVIPDQPINEELLNYPMNIKGLLLDFDRNTKKKLLESSDPSVKAEFVHWQQLRKKYLTLIQEYSADQIAVDTVAQNLKNNIQALERNLLQRSESFKNLRSPKNTTCAQIRSALPADAAAIEFFRIFKPNLKTKKITDTVYYAAILLRKDQSAPEVIFFRNGDELETTLAEQYRRQASDEHPDPTITRQLYASFWAPLAPYLKGIKTIYFSPDGVFHKINPEILQESDGRYLSDLYDFRRVNVLADIILKSPEIPASALSGKPAVLFGNPDFSATAAISPDQASASDLNRGILDAPVTERGIILNALPGSEKEVLAIDALLRTKNVLPQTFTGKTATEEQLKALKSPAILHLATHGYFLENTRNSRQTIGFDKETVVENPLLRSMLFFAGAQGTLDKAPRDEDAEDGVLTAEEAQDLDLDGCELVVLSACGSGLGKIESGEGVFGLQRAFQVAGAKTIIVSLWQVEDRVTQLLMTTFYQNWLGGMTKHDAFSKAQKTVREKYPAAFYWGAFVMIGG